MSDTIEQVPAALIGAEATLLALSIRAAIEQRLREADLPPLVPVQITDDGETYAGVR